MANLFNPSNSPNSNESSKLSLKIVTDLPNIIKPTSVIDDGDSNHYNAEIRDNPLANTPSHHTQPSHDHYVNDSESKPTIHREPSQSAMGLFSAHDGSSVSSFNSENTTSPSGSSSDNSSIDCISNRNDTSRYIESRLNLILSGLPEHDDDDDDDDDDEEKNDDIFLIFNNEDRYTVDWSDDDQQNVSPQTIHGFGDSSNTHLALQPQPPLNEEYEMMHVMSAIKGPSRPGTAENSPRSDGYNSESSIGAIIMGVCVSGNTSIQYPTSSVYVSGQSDPMTAEEAEDDDDYA